MKNSYLQNKALEIEREMEIALFEGFPSVANLYKRQAEFLYKASDLIPESKHADFWTRCLLGDIPNYPNKL